MTETKEKKAEVQIKTGKKTTAQKAFRIAELFVIWAVRSFLYSGCTFVFSWSSTLFMERPLAMNLSKLEHLYVE